MQASDRHADRLPRVAIVGDGLAGAAVGAAFARRGLAADLFAPAEPAPGAGGLPAGLLVPHLATQMDPLARWRRAGLRVTRTWLADLERSGYDSGRLAQGVVSLPTGPRSRARHDRLPRHGADSIAIDAAEVERLTGMAVAPEAAILHAAGATIAPRRFSAGLIAAAGPTVRVVRQRISAIHCDSGGWRLRPDPDAAERRYAHVVIAAGPGTRSLVPGVAAMTEIARGQATGVAANPASREQRLALSGNGYVTMPVDDVHWVGATFSRGDNRLGPRAADDRANVARFEQYWPARDPARVVQRFVGLRVTTVDRLPIVGEMAPGLWVSVGHGSHGLLTAPLGGLLIAAALAGDTPPALLRLVHPQRRALARFAQR